MDDWEVVTEIRSIFTMILGFLLGTLIAKLTGGKPKQPGDGRSDDF